MADMENGGPRGGGFLIEPVGSREPLIPADYAEDQKAFGKTMRDFMNNEVLPRIDEIEAMKEGVLPALLKKAGELGFLMLDIPERYGGLGAEKAASLLLTEQSTRLASFSVGIGAHTGIGTLPIVFFGSEEQKRRYLPKLATGELLAAYALTEPGAGSDALNAKTRAVLSDDGKHYILDGVKQWISNAGFADLFIVFAKVDGEKFTGFIVEADTPGFSTGVEEKKMGIKGSSTRQVILEKVKVPVENVLGEIGKGHKIAFNALNIGRYKLGVNCAGGAKDSLQFAVKYGIDRRQFNTRIVDFGAIKKKIADMTVAIFALESMNLRTAGMMDEVLHGIPEDDPNWTERVLGGIEEFATEDSILKVHGTEVLDHVVDEALQIYGGYGYVEDYPIERHYRDSRVNRLFEGTNEINRLLIPGMLMKRVSRGRLPLFEAVQRVGAELSDPEQLPKEGEGPLAAEIQAVELAKREVLYTVNAVIQKHMETLDREQQALEMISDLLIESYAIDSTVGRVLKLIRLRCEEKVETQIDMAKIVVAESVERIHTSSRRLVASVSERTQLEEHLASLEKLHRFLPTNLFEAKERVAAVMTEAQGDWIFGPM